MFYSFSETSARKCRWRDSVWSAARRGGLPLLRLELARGAAGSKLPAKESGSKLPHSKKDVKNIRNELNKSFSINKSAKKTNPNELKTNSKNVLKIRQKAKTNWKTHLTGEEQENGNNQPSGNGGKCNESKEFPRPYKSAAYRTRC